MKCFLIVIHDHVNIHSLCCSLRLACCLSRLRKSLANWAVTISTCRNDTARVSTFDWTCIQCDKLQNPFYIHEINVISAAPTIHAQKSHIPRYRSRKSDFNLCLIDKGRNFSQSQLHRLSPEPRKTKGAIMCPTKDVNHQNSFSRVLKCYLSTSVTQYSNITKDQHFTDVLASPEHQAYATPGRGFVYQ